MQQPSRPLKRQPAPDEPRRADTGLTHTVVRLRPATASQKCPSPVPPAPPSEREEEEEQRPHQKRRWCNKKNIFLLLLLLACLLLLWLFAEMLIKRLALNLLFQNSNLPPVSNAPPRASAAARSNHSYSIDLHRDVRLL